MRYSRNVLTTDTLTRVSWRARPRSFVALMGLYESNFIRLGWLAGAWRRLPAPTAPRCRRIVIFFSP